MTIEPLVDELARLDRQRRREIVEAADHERQIRIRRALQQIRKTLLSSFKDRQAARAIDDAIRGRRASFRAEPALQIDIERYLKQELGCLDDIPGADRIRQLLRH